MGACPCTDLSRMTLPRSIRLCLLERNRERKAHSEQPQPHPRWGKKNLKKSIASFYKYFLPISCKCLVCEPRQEQGLLGQLFSSLALASPASSSDAG